MKLKCPFGDYDSNHEVTWRCFATYGCDWIVGFDHLPEFIYKFVYWLVLKIEQPIELDDVH